MKKILLPTDFSDNAQASAHYAAFIANQLNVQIDIVHVTDLVSSLGLYEEAQSISRNRIRKNFHDLGLGMEAIIEGDLLFDTLLLSGNTTSALASIIAEYDLVVMSAKGEADLDRLFLGSTTKHLIQQNETPVLVVPPSYKFQDIKKIVWALDDQTVSTSGQIHPLPEITGSFKAKLEIFHQDEGQRDQGLLLDLAIFLEDIDYSVHYNFDENHIIDAILSFAEDEKADLICMIYHPRHPLIQFFNPSKTLSSISKSKVPLLILPERDVTEN